MFVIELILLIFSSITGVIASIFVFQKTNKSPLLETFILGIGVFLFSIAFLLYIPLAYIYSPGDNIDVTPIIENYYQTGAAFATFGIFIVYLAIYLPTFQVTYRKIIVILSSNIIFVTSIVLNYQLDIVIHENRIILVYPPITAFFISLSQILLVILIFYRVRSVSKITESSPFQSNVSLFIVLVLGFATSVSITIPVIFPDSVFPTFTNAFLTSVLFLFFGYTFNKDDAFIFITSAHLEAILIADRNSGISLFSKNFNEDLPTEELLTSVFTGVNLSINSIIKANHDINEIVFGDKVIQIKQKNEISVFLITSKVNMISTQILNFITEQFYEKFETMLKSNSSVVRYVPNIRFDKEINWVKRYMPL